MFYQTDVFMQATLPPDTDTAILTSPNVYIPQPSCLSFNYFINSQKVDLIVKITTATQPARIEATTLLFEKQSFSNNWNSASISLKSGVTRIEFIAEKFGYTKNSQVVSLDSIVLTDGVCQPGW